jgi:hypothetical protein
MKKPSQILQTFINEQVKASKTGQESLIFWVVVFRTGLAQGTTSPPRSSEHDLFYPSILWCTGTSIFSYLTPFDTFWT